MELRETLGSDAFCDTERLPDAAAAGPARVITLHASAGSSRQWRELPSALGAAWNVELYDHIDHGRGAPWLCPVPPALADHGAAALRALEATRQPAHVVAHSFGGVVALALALDRPALVRSLTLYEPVLVALLTRQERLSAPEQQVFRVADAVRLAVRRGRRLEAAQEFVGYWSGFEAWSAMDVTTRATIAARMPAVAGHFDAIESAQALVERLPELQLPVLLMVGERTTASARRIVERLVALLPQARCQVVSGAGHMGPITHAGAVNARIAAFLHALPASACSTLQPPLHERMQST